MIILSGNKTDTFAPDSSFSKTKGYLVLILAFTAMMNIIVSDSAVLGSKYH